jgi:hypothetical protein
MWQHAHIQHEHKQKHTKNTPQAEARASIDIQHKNKLKQIRSISIQHASSKSKHTHNTAHKFKQFLPGTGRSWRELDRSLEPRLMWFVLFVCVFCLSFVCVHV